MGSQDRVDAPNRVSYLGLSLISLKAGVSALGGGYAIIPGLKSEVVTRLGLVDDAEFLQVLATAQCCPGSLAVNCCVGLGYKLHGLLGALVSGVCVLIPSIAGVLAFVLGFSILPAGYANSAVFKGLRLGSATLITMGAWILVKPMRHSFIKIVEVLCWLMLMRVVGVSPTITLGAAFLLSVGKWVMGRMRDRRR